MGGNYRPSHLEKTTVQGHGAVPSSRLLKKSASLSCSFGLFGLSGWFVWYVWLVWFVLFIWLIWFIWLVSFNQKTR